MPARTYKEPRIQEVLRGGSKRLPLALCGLSLVFLTMVVAGLWAAKPHPEQRKFELKAESASFWKLISPDAKLATLASGLAKINTIV